MNCNMRFRPVVCADGRLLLPTPQAGLQPQIAWDGWRYGSACLHPDHPSRAVFQLVALPPGWPNPRAGAPQVLAFQMDEAALRRAAREFTELADEIALKPATRKTPRKRK